MNEQRVAVWSQRRWIDEVEWSQESRYAGGELQELFQEMEESGTENYDNCLPVDKLAHTQRRVNLYEGKCT
jgi:hypothetical protein